MSVELTAADYRTAARIARNLGRPSVASEAELKADRLDEVQSAARAKQEAAARAEREYVFTADELRIAKRVLARLSSESGGPTTVEFLERDLNRAIKRAEVSE